MNTFHLSAVKPDFVCCSAHVLFPVCHVVVDRTRGFGNGIKISPSSVMFEHGLVDNRTRILYFLMIDVNPTQCFGRKKKKRHFIWKILWLTVTFNGLLLVNIQKSLNRVVTIPISNLAVVPDFDSMLLTNANTTFGGSAEAKTSSLLTLWLLNDLYFQQ